MHTHTHICKNIFFVVCPKREKNKYFKMNKSTKRFEFFRIFHFVLT